MKNLLFCASIICVLSGMAFAQDNAVWLNGDDSWNIALKTAATWDRSEDVVLQFEAWGGPNAPGEPISGAWPDCNGDDLACDRGIGLWCGFWNGLMPQEQDPVPCGGDVGNLGCAADYHYEFVFCPLWGWDWAGGPGGIGILGTALNQNPPACGTQTGLFGQGSAIIDAFVASDYNNRVTVQLVLGATAGANIRYSTDGGSNWVDEPNSQYADCADLVDQTTTGISVGFIGFGNSDSGGVYIDNVSITLGGIDEITDDFSSGTFSAEWNVTDLGGGSITIVDPLTVSNWELY